MVTGQICPSGSFCTAELLMFSPSRVGSKGSLQCLANVRGSGRALLTWDHAVLGRAVSLPLQGLAGRHRSHSDSLVSVSWNSEQGALSGSFTPSQSL